MMMRSLCVAGVSVLSLLACAQNTPGLPTEVLPPPDVVSQSPEPGLATVRVIVQFNQPQAYGDAAFLKTLQKQAQARVRYLAAVSDDTHVYSVQLPADQNPTPALQRLRALPSIIRVEIDETAKAH
jgi:hypothetical protein